MTDAIETVFLDRDGTINRKAPEGDYITRWERFCFLDGAEAALRLLTDLGLRLVVVTNQRGVALGRMTDADLASIHARMHQAVLRAGGRIDAVYSCRHGRGACDCRKPARGLFDQAQEADPEIDFRRSAVIGDADSDMEAARTIGAESILIADAARASAGAVTYTAPTLWHAAVWLRDRSRRSVTPVLGRRSDAV